jgi:D-lactate dehydrogenase (cytochrome)
MKAHLFAAPVAEHFADYLRDESRRAGWAETISFPHDEDDIREVIRVSYPGGLAVTTQGGRTGLTGGAVPNGGHILNTARMNRITGLRFDAARGSFLLTVQPGVVLSELRKCLHTCEFDTAGWTPAALEALARMQGAGRFFFPPDPTESSASLGGMTACNASGACAFQYGPTRNYVEALRVVLADGSVLALRRGVERVVNRAFSVTTTDGGRTIQGRIPSYAMPATKNAAGFFACDEMDLLDLFIGSEGVLGVFSEIELRVVPLPGCRWGVMVFFPDETTAVRFVKAVRETVGSLRPVAVEFFDGHALNLLRRQKEAHASFSWIPDMPPAFHTAIYVEYHGDEAAVTEAVETMSGLVIRSGGTEEATWIATTESEIDRLKLFRHAVPESVNMLIDERRRTEPELTKLGTDMAVPDTRLDNVLSMYHDGLDKTGLEHVIFGHIGNNHLHVNILPRSLQDYNVGKDLYLSWARQVVGMGGTISAEHGVGKFKVALLREMYAEAGIQEMREVKRLFDPEGKLNRGNLF